MKKRLFISSILMTLVLLVAITTATFAWYQATAQASVGGSHVEKNNMVVTAPADLKTDAAEYTITVTLTPVLYTGVEKTELVLAEYYEAGAAKRVGEGTYAAAGWHRFYRNQQGTLLEDTDNRTYGATVANTLFSKIYKVSVAISGGALEGDALADVLDAYGTKVVHVAFTSTGAATLTIGTDDYDSENEATEFLDDRAPLGANSDLTFTWGSWTGESKVLGYVQIYVDGDDSETATPTYTTGNLSFELTATVSIQNS